MRVQRVLMPVTDAESWTVLGDDGVPVESIETFLAFLSAVERSPNTQKAYATSLKLWFEFLAAIETRFDAAGPDEVARFVSWFRASAPNVVVLAEGVAKRAPATVNRHLAAVFAFYEHHARSGGTWRSG